MNTNATARCFLNEEVYNYFRQIIETGFLRYHMADCRRHYIEIKFSFKEFVKDTSRLFHKEKKSLVYGLWFMA